MKRTEKSQPDHENLHRAISALEEVMTYVLVTLLCFALAPSCFISAFQPVLLMSRVSSGRERQLPLLYFWPVGKVSYWKILLRWTEQSKIVSGCILQTDLLYGSFSDYFLYIQYQNSK